MAASGIALANAHTTDTSDNLRASVLLGHMMKKILDLILGRNQPKSKKRPSKPVKKVVPKGATRDPVTGAKLKKKDR